MDGFSQHGVQLAVVGNGGSYALIKFRKVTGYPGILATDPSLETYKILKFKNGLADVVGIKSFIQGFSAFSSGLMTGSLHGHALLLGGAVVVVPEGRITYFFMSSASGDHMPVEDLLTAAT